MASQRYRVKLYGFTGDNEDVFARSIATLVGVDAHRAGQFLKDVPVVIAEGLQKDRADSIVEALSIMKGLCLSEPMEGGGSADELAEMARVAISRIETDRDIFEDKGFFPGGKRTTIALGSGVALLILLMVIMLSTPDTKPTPQPTPSDTGKPAGMVRDLSSSDEDPLDAAPHSDQDAQGGVPYSGWSVKELVEEHDAIEEENVELFDGLRSLNRVMGHGTGTPYSHELRGQRSRQVAETRSQLRSNLRELRLIKRRVLMLKRRRNRP